MALSADLSAIRHLFRSTGITGFTPQLQNAIISTLQDPNYGFDAYRKIRFRSSTNVEDSNQFTGAGLYESFSGCLADDLDGDSDGPCLCDADEDNERGDVRMATHDSESGVGTLAHVRLEDEGEGEGYEGSSCRGAIRGWYSMGVCTEELAPYVAAEKNWSLSVEQAKDANEGAAMRRSSEHGQWQRTSAGL